MNVIICTEILTAKLVYSVYHINSVIECRVQLAY